MPKNGFLPPKNKRAGPENLPGAPGEGAWRARQTCLAGPAKVPGGPGEPAWQLLTVCTAQLMSGCCEMT